MRTVRVAGVGMTEFGERPSVTGRALFSEAVSRAFADTSIPREDVEAVHYGNFMGELAEHQGHQGPLMAEAAGVTAPATRYESACASGGVAVKTAVDQIRHGDADVVLAGGAERMNNLGTAGATDALSIAADDLWEVKVGMTFPGAYALMTRAYLDEFGGTREDLAHVAVKNHEHALPNDHAHFQRQIDVDDVIEAPTVSDPIGLYEASPITDGAAVVLLVSDEYASKNGVQAGVRVSGSGQGSDNIALHDRESLVRTPATRRAGQRALSHAEIDREDVDLVEVHDCFTIAEVLALEGLGFYDTGEAISAAVGGETWMDGELPVNLSGGLKAKGHPVGATGASQIVEMTRLLRGDHPRSDAVSAATTGITHNAGGTVASAVVHVLEYDP